MGLAAPAGAAPELREITPGGPLSSAVIRFDRGEHYDITAPSYSVEIHGDGTIIYRGGRYVLLEGEWRWKVSRGAVAELVERLDDPAFRTVSPRYDIEGNRNHWPEVSLSLVAEGRVMTVTDKSGGNDVPKAVTELWRAIDDLAGVEALTDGDATTVERLRVLGVRRTSAEAGAIVARAVLWSPEGMAERLLDAGYPAWGWTRDPWDGQRIPAVAAAALRGRTALFERLLAAGAFEKGPAGVKEAALRAAAQGPAPEMLREVLARGAKVDGRGPGGVTALMIATGTAARYLQDEDKVRPAVRLLLAAGADPNLTDRMGQTAIFGARDPEIARMLIEAGARLDVRSNRSHQRPGDTPLCATFTEEVAVALIEAGADLETPCWNGETFEVYRGRQNWRKAEAAIRRRRAA